MISGVPSLPGILATPFHDTHSRRNRDPTGAQEPEHCTPCLPGSLLLPAEGKR